MDKQKPKPDKIYSAKDLRTAADLSYRQLHDWEAKGVFDSKRKGGSGWRRFEPREFFALMVCAEIRRKFGVPVESLRRVKSFMMQETANHFAAAVELIAVLGIPVFLLTDFRETFIMDSALEFRDMLAMGTLGGEESGAYVFLEINPLVNRLLGALKKPIRLEEHGAGYRIVQEFHEMFGARDVDELQVLELLRNRALRKIEVELRDGTMVGGSVEEECSGDLTMRGMEKILSEKAFQSVTAVKHDGETVRIQRRVPLKFSQHKKRVSPKQRRKSEPRESDDTKD